MQDQPLPVVKHGKKNPPAPIGKPKPPMAPEDGVTPSRVRLPEGHWPTIYEFLCFRFAHLKREYLLEQIEAGRMKTCEGMPITVHTPFIPNSWIWYYRQVPIEYPLPEPLTILYQDEYLIAVDKPHFMATTPGGQYLRNTALVQLRSMVGQLDVNPIHRLDRDTAGVLIFATKPEYRGAYQQMFQDRAVTKVYECIAPVNPDLALPHTHRSLMARSDHFFVMKEYPGQPNSETLIELIAQQDGLGHFRLHPHTGRKHQLRLHMAVLGMPICNDAFYPVLLPQKPADDFSEPLQLLARSIAFTDPHTGQERYFESRRQLSMAALCTGELCT